MRILASPTAIRRARARMARRAYAVLAIWGLCCAAIIASHYLFGWW